MPDAALATFSSESTPCGENQPSVSVPRTEDEAGEDRYSPQTSRIFLSCVSVLVREVQSKALFGPHQAWVRGLRSVRVNLTMNVRAC